MQPKVFYVWDFSHMQHRAARPACTGARLLFAHPVVSSCYAVSSLTSPQYSAKDSTILQCEVRCKSRLNFIITFKEEAFS